jgi:hypothetical protein
MLVFSAKRLLSCTAGRKPSFDASFPSSDKDGEADRGISGDQCISRSLSLAEVDLMLYMLSEDPIGGIDSG